MSATVYHWFLLLSDLHDAGVPEEALWWTSSEGVLRVRPAHPDDPDWHLGEGHNTEELIAYRNFQMWGQF